MYTADASINAKVKGASGWRELLKLLGFRFQKASNGIPDSVFFPSVTSGVTDKLAAASNHLHALLGKAVFTAGRLNCWYSRIRKERKENPMLVYGPSKRHCYFV